MRENEMAEREGFELYEISHDENDKDGQTAPTPDPTLTISGPYEQITWADPIEDGTVPGPSETRFGHLVSQNIAKSPEDSISLLPAPLRQIITKWKSLPPELQAAIVAIASSIPSQVGDKNA